MVFDSKQIASKFLDGDLNSKNDLLQLVSDKDAKVAYSRYQLIGNLMRQEAIAPDVCIADGVMDALADEATVLAPRKDKVAESQQGSSVISLPARLGKRVAKQIGGFAIAASVALVALLNTNMLGQNSQIPQVAGQNFATQVVATNTAVAAIDVDREQLEQAHQFFSELSQLQNAGLPVIQTVSNQKAVAIQVPLAKAQEQEVKQDDRDLINKQEMKQ